MDDKIKKGVVVFSMIAMTVLFITGISIFISGHEKELEKEDEKNEFYETDTALRMKDDCDKRKNAEACLKTGLYYLDGKIVQVNREKAARYLLKACDMRSAVGCYQLGKFWQGDAENGKMNRKAKLYFSRACDLGDIDACEIVKRK